ncbi:MAG: hypothetical protein ACYSYU_10845, partial [Planctomycetota bacterium]
PLEQVPETPIGDFVAGQDRALEHLKSRFAMPTPADQMGSQLPEPDLSEFAGVDPNLGTPAAVTLPAPLSDISAIPTGRQKGPGYFGTLDLPGGDVSTEYSIGVNLDGRETEIPTLVPTLTEEELSLMVNDIIPNKKEIPEVIINKAISHARQRLSEGKGPFMEDVSEAPAQPLSATARRFEAQGYPEAGPPAPFRGHPDEPPPPAPPELTLGRLGHQTAARFGQGIENLMRGEQVLHGQTQTVPETEYPVHQPKFEEGAFLKGLYNRPELREKLRHKKREKAVSKLKPMPEYFPEPLEGSSGLIEEGISGVAEFMPAMMGQAVNPAIGAGAIFETIVGSKYKEYMQAPITGFEKADPYIKKERENLKKERATKLAILNAALATPIEFAGNILQFKLLGNIAQKFAGKPGGKTIKWVLDFLKIAATEGGEEFLQTPPDEIINIVAANPDLSPQEIVAEVWGKKAEIAKRSGRAFAAGAIGGGALAGAGGVIMSPALLSQYRSEKQIKIDEQTPPTEKVEVAPEAEGVTDYKLFDERLRAERSPQDKLRGIFQEEAKVEPSEKPTPKAPAASQAPKPEAPGVAATPTEPDQVPPFPGQDKALPAPLQAPEPAPAPKPKAPDKATAPESENDITAQSLDYIKSEGPAITFRPSKNNAKKPNEPVGKYENEVMSKVGDGVNLGSTAQPLIYSEWAKGLGTKRKTL